MTSEALSDVVIQLSEDGKKLDTDEFEELISGDEESMDEVLVSLARSAREKAFAPYSEFPVGAALLTEKGVYLGANIEISGRSTSVHAEMLAAFKATFDGATEFQAMSVSTPRQSNDTGPCGLCQHTLSQFTDELRIIEDGGNDDHGIFYLSDLIGDGYSASTRHKEHVSS